ncbi:MAG: glutathione peroxidase [Pseudomonadota bacterium]|nr:glutathione peroxidase [Pseudomonadota bacterium]
MDFNSFSVTNSQGKSVPLSDYDDKVLLIVNTASKCGFTPQYDGLEALYKEYQSMGLEIIAFPCNQFGKQEPGDNAAIQEFCSLTFDVTFPVMAKVDVNGENTIPLYEYLKKAAPGVLGTQGIKWNFTKFLVSRDRKNIKRYAPKDKPEALKSDIENMLNM